MVDRVTLLDDDLRVDQPQQPPAIDALLKPAEPQPWHKPLMVTLFDALLTGHSIAIDITTNSHSWAMRVTGQ